MFDRAAEHVAAGSNPRFRAFVDGKSAFEAYVSRLERRFHELTPADFERARSDEQLETAQQRFATAIALSEKADSIVDAATANYQLGLIHHLRGEHEAARAALVAALRVFAALPDVALAKPASDCHYHLGLIALREHRLGDAMRELRRARSIDLEMGDLSGAQLSEEAIGRCVEEGGSADGPVPADPTLFGRWESADLQEAEPDTADAASDTARRPGPVSYNQREVVWLASYSVEANDAVETHLETLGDEIGRPVVISRVAFGADRPELRRLLEPESDQHVCAAVLVLERGGLADAGFQGFGFLCIQRVSERADFRLLVHLHDISLHELRAEADHNRFVAQLFDTTQVAEQSSSDALRRALVPFIRRVERLAAAEWWREVRLNVTSRLSTAIVLLFCLAAIMAVVGYPLSRFFPTVMPRLPFVANLASFNLGLLAFVLQAPLLFMLVRGLRVTSLAPRSNQWFLWFVVLCSLLMVAANETQHALGGPSSWVWLGLGTGIVLEVIRRAGWSARRQLLDLEALLKKASDPALRNRSLTIGSGDALNPFKCPFLPTPTPRIFISYSRSSEHASGLAAALFRDLKASGATPFLDRASIPVGASWRRALNQHLGECDAFVCILDSKSLQRPWVGAEVLAALAARRLTGTPDILLLLDPAVDVTQPEVLPLFRGVADAFHDAPVTGRPRIVPLGSETRRVTSWALASGHFQPMAVLTRVSAVPVWMVLTILAPIGGIGFPAGFILGPIALMQASRSGGFPFAPWLEGKGMLEWALLLVSFWAGSMARHTAAVWAAERTPQPESGAMAPAISALGLIWMAQVLAMRVTALWLGWAIVLGVAGWLVVAVGVRISTGTPGQRLRSA